jgi:hypothetical protein
VFGVCSANPLSEETRRRGLPYAVLGVLTYTSVVWVGAGIVICGLIGFPINFKWVGSLMGAAILLKHFGTLLVLRRMATITGEPVPQISLWCHVWRITFAGMFVAIGWT